MAKKIISLLLALSLVCNFTACDNSESVTTPSATTRKNPSPIPTSTSAPSSNQETPVGTGTTTRTEDSEKGTVTLEAFPADDCGFIGWASDEAGETMVSYYNPYTFDTEKEVPLYPVFVHKEQIISLQDTAIKNEIQQQFSSDTSIVTYENLQQITSLTIYHPQSLADLSYFHALGSLTIYLDSAIKYDFAPLANLTNITTFYVQGASVDVLPIENYKKIKELRVNYTGKNVFIFASSKNTLEILDLDNPAIENYEFLAEFTNLKTFCISNILSIENILPYLPKSIDSLSIGNITNSNGFKNLVNHKNLKNLWITNMSLAENELSSLPELLETLSIQNCSGIKSLNFLSKLVHLKELNINACWMNDIRAIENLKKLENLNLNNNLISDLSSLSQLTELKTLEITNNRITDLTPLNKLREYNLTYVYAYFNPIVDYSFFETMPSYTAPYSEWVQAVSTAKTMVETVIQAGMTEQEKYFALANILCEKVTDTGGNYAYDALVAGKGYAQAYTDAYLLLCTIANLPCYYISGKINGTPHCWNIVKVDGHFYNVDISRMDKSDKIDTAYFLKSDTFFENQSYTNFSQRAPELICNDSTKDTL